MALVGSGFLLPGETEQFTLVMRGGVTHRIYVRPFEPGVDFDLYVYDENNRLVDQDVKTDPDALCRITPKWTGPFRLVVKSARGASMFGIRVEAI